MKSIEATRRLLLMLKGSYVDEAVSVLETDATNVSNVLSKISRVRENLSSGERFVFKCALAVWNGNREAAIADLGSLSKERKIAVLDVLEEYYLSDGR